MEFFSIWFAGKGVGLCLFEGGTLKFRDIFPGAMLISGAMPIRNSRVPALPGHLILLFDFLRTRGFICET